jgi:hypothetical protein
MIDLDKEVKEKLRKLKGQDAGNEDEIEIQDVKIENLQGVEKVVVYLCSFLASIFLCPMYLLGCCRVV